MDDAPKRPRNRVGRPKGSKNKRGANFEFRQYWRAFFESREGRKLLKKRARESDTILAKLLDKSFATPTELDISFNRIPADFTFRCELSSRGGTASPSPVGLPAPCRGGSGD